MRAILTLSLPPAEKKIIERRAKKARKTVSAYILSVVKLEQKLIQEDELCAMAREAERDYAQRNVKRLKSLADLMD